MLSRHIHHLCRRLTERFWARGGIGPGWEKEEADRPLPNTLGVYTDRGTDLANSTDYKGKGACRPLTAVCVQSLPALGCHTDQQEEGAGVPQGVLGLGGHSACAPQYAGAPPKVCTTSPGRELLQLSEDLAGVEDLGHPVALPPPASAARWGAPVQLASGQAGRLRDRRRPSGGSGQAVGWKLMTTWEKAEWCAARRCSLAPGASLRAAAPAGLGGAGLRLAVPMSLSPEASSINLMISERPHCYHFLFQNF
ncbi:hypothetical protein Cadr_000027768 [Camelus dromedarius]|uniref:Uncharacterized protein n=1 Tax=Camelus dromedarius TaxID=9838 RepID=A0A5N4CB93_CAMDR|nr:hypothetical protein Cadr_000027768 [Camelus dromedarius]